MFLNNNTNCLLIKPSSGCVKLKPNLTEMLLGPRMPFFLSMKPACQIPSSPIFPGYLVPSRSSLASTLSLSSLQQLQIKNHVVPPLGFSKRPTSPSQLHSSSPSFNPSTDSFEDEDNLLGDCLVFEEGVFEDPFPHSGFQDKRARKQVLVTENLVPEEWRETQDEINMTKKEKRKIAQQLEFGSRVEKRKIIKVPDANQYLAYKALKLAQLKPVVLDTPYIPPEIPADDDDEDKDEDDGEREQIGVKENARGVKNGEFGCSSSGRVMPSNPRLKVAGSTFEAITELFNNNYVSGEDSSKNSQGPRKLFTKEEKVLLNKRIPNLAEATSRKWLPVHTLAASGQFYLLDLLLKHNVDINAVDKDGCTALHKAILGKKQAVTNYLLRESANPFVRDKDGATLMHYAVQVASVQAIKILLLYNVDINLSDNYGWTPLHLAVQIRRTDVVKLLLIKGADRTLKNQDGLTPLDLCLYSGQYLRTYELIKLLKGLHK